MTADDAATILATLTAARMRFSPQIDQHTIGLWAQNLRDITADVGLETARRLTSSEEDFPTIAKFCGVAREVGRANRQRALPAQGVGYRCRCEDVRMICADVEADTWYPCPKCNLEAFQRWEAGEYHTKVFRAALQPADAELSKAALAKVRAELEKRAS